MRSLVFPVGLFFIVLTAACNSGLHSYRAPDGGGTGGSGGLIVSDHDGGATGLPGGTTSASAGTTSVGGATSLSGGTTDSTGGASSTGGILPMGGTSSTGGIPPEGGTTSTGGILSMGGTSSAGGTSGGGAGGSSIPFTGNCAALTCLNPLNDLLATCQTGATDTCTQQTTMTSTIVVNSCYTNGVKEQTSIGTDLLSATMTVKSGSSVCYSMAISGLSGNVVTVVVKNGSGTTVATIAQDSTTSIETVACPGGTPTVVDATCGSGNTSNVGTSMPDTSNCTDGTCAWADH
jgi:hypothetical protein